MFKKLWILGRRLVTKDALSMTATTGFFRNEAQMRLLARIQPGPRTAYVFGSSDGCEAYTLAIAYRQEHPGLDLRITGFDVVSELLEKAAAGVYGLAQVDYYGGGRVLAGDKARFFTRGAGGGYGVSPEIVRSCTFRLGDVLDSEFMSRLEPADIVLCQNVLIHLGFDENLRALGNLTRVLARGGVLAIGGMRPDWRSGLTRRLGLAAVAEACREIHDGWADARKAWDDSLPGFRRYYALEPFSDAPDWPRRYGTLFRAASDAPAIAA